MDLIFQSLCAAAFTLQKTLGFYCSSGATTWLAPPFMCILIPPFDLSLRVDASLTTFFTVAALEAALTFVEVTVFRRSRADLLLHSFMMLDLDVTSDYDQSKRSFSAAQRGIQVSVYQNNYSFRMLRQSKPNDGAWDIPDIPD